MTMIIKEKKFYLQLWLENEYNLYNPRGVQNQKLKSIESYKAEVYSEPNQTSKMEVFGKGELFPFSGWLFSPNAPSQMWRPKRKVSRNNKFQNLK